MHRGMAEPMPDPREIDLTDHLTAFEDAELRWLCRLSEMGLLTERSKERLIELRLKDRRHDVREPVNPEDL